MENTCNHSSPELCTLLGKHLTPNLEKIWYGLSEFSTEQEEAYRDHWISKSGRPPEDFEPYLSRESRKELKIPPAKTQAVNLIKAVAKRVKNFKNVTAEQKEERLKICKGCEYFSPKKGRCTKCGCLTKLKAGWLSENCPVNKWPEL
jgi:hypothetical protein